MQIGDRVIVAEKGKGIVRYVGETLFAPGIRWVGVELEDPKGKNDGSVQGERYFTCKSKHGAFVREDAVQVIPPEKKPVVESPQKKTEKLHEKPKTPPKNAVEEVEATPPATPTAIASGIPTGISSSAEKRPATPVIASPIEHATPPPSVKSTAGASPRPPTITDHIECHREIDSLKGKLAQLEQMADKKAKALIESESKLEVVSKQLEEHSLHDKKLADVAAHDKEKINQLEVELKSLRHKIEENEIQYKTNMSSTASKLERQIEKLKTELDEANEMVEALSLDKEQALLDKELADERASELEIEIESLKVDLMEAKESPSEEGSGDLSEENAKLRDALKRLHTSSGAEKVELNRQIRVLTQENSSLKADATELETLRGKTKSMEDQMEELKSMLDTANAFESMVEQLTDRNLDLSDQVAELKTANEELEELRALSEEMEQQHLEMQAQWQSERVNLMDELDLESTEKRSLAERLVREHQIIDQLTQELHGAREEQETFTEKLADMSAMEHELQKTKGTVRETKLALIDEETATRRKLIETGMALLERSTMEISYIHFNALVPDSLLGYGSQQSLAWLVVIRKLEEYSKLLAVTVPHDTEIGCDIQQAAYCISEACTQIKQLTIAEANFSVLENWSAKFTNTFAKTVGCVAAIVQLVNTGGSLMDNHCVMMTQSSSEVIAAMKMIIAERSPKKRECIADFECYVALVTLLCTCAKRILYINVNDMDVEEGMIDILHAACGIIASICNGWSNRDSASTATLFTTVQLLSQTLQTESDISVLQSECRSLNDYKESLSESRHQEDDIVIAAWKPFAASCKEKLGAVAEIQEELEGVKVVLKKRVLEVHEKSSQIEALNHIRDDLQKQLDHFRSLSLDHSESTTARQDLLNKVDALEQQLAQQRADHQLAVTNMEAKIHSDKKNIEHVESNNKNTRQGTVTETSPAAIEYLRQQVSFWKRKSMIHSVKHLTPLHVAGHQVSHESQDANAKRLLEESLILQSKIRFASESDSFSALRLQKKLDHLRFSKSDGKVFNVGTIEMGNASPDNQALSIPMEINALDYSRLYQLIPLVLSGKE